MVFQSLGGAAGGEAVDLTQHGLRAQPVGLRVGVAAGGGEFETALEVQVLGVALGDPQFPPDLFEEREPGGGRPQRIGLIVDPGRQQGRTVGGQDRTRTTRIPDRPDHERIEDQLHGPAQRPALGPAQRLHTLETAPHLIEHHGPRSSHEPRLSEFRRVRGGESWDR
ncbi:hypothetical protein IU448_16060 [Nocardia flavorosea]|uniref:hypothetical protein n=1 Tax=Nocardia flavorosea TaxID=53429 RepID=UPI001893AEFC|nr:hypothetical protein [Nocardia flavorosea]